MDQIFNFGKEKKVMATERVYRAIETIDSDCPTIASSSRTVFDTTAEKAVVMFPNATSLIKIFDLAFALENGDADVVDEVQAVIEHHFGNWDTIAENAQILATTISDYNELDISDVFSIASDSDTADWRKLENVREYGDGEYKVIAEYVKKQKNTYVTKAFEVVNSNGDTIIFKTTPKGIIKQREWGIGRTFDLFKSDLAVMIAADYQARTNGSKGKIRAKLVLESYITVTVTRK